MKIVTAYFFSFFEFDSDNFQDNEIHQNLQAVKSITTCLPFMYIRDNDAIASLSLW